MLPPEKQVSEKRKFTIFLVISLLFHLTIILFPWSKEAKKPQKLFTVELVPLDRIKSQIVDDTEQANKQKSDSAKYLSKNDNTVKEETKAPVTGKTKNTPESQLGDPNINKKAKEESSKRKLSMADLGLKPMKASRKPSTYSPPSQSDDYLPNVKSGAQTSLNTREFQFYSYFERIKERLRMHWEPQLQRRVNILYARGEELPPADLLTKLDIILTKEGELTKILVLRRSGFSEIDEAAIKAFELAAPFPNPPSGMIENNGSVQLSWSFVVQNRGISDIFVFLSKR